MRGRGLLWQSSSPQSSLCSWSSAVPTACPASLPSFLARCPCFLVTPSPHVRSECVTTQRTRNGSLDGGRTPCDRGAGARPVYLPISPPERQATGRTGSRAWRWAEWAGLHRPQSPVRRCCFRTVASHRESCRCRSLRHGSRFPCSSGCRPVRTCIRGGFSNPILSESAGGAGPRGMGD